MSVVLTDLKVRALNVEALGLAASVGGSASTPIDELEPMEKSDPIYLDAEDLLQTYGGIIFVGPPGTSKSWSAARLAVALVDGDRSRVRFVQFHPSFQYEDFVEGFVPRKSGGFKLVSKHFLDLCDIARDGSDLPAVLVIDELSRGDPGRVFGEALTYIEKSKRGLKFNLASGREIDVPDGLVVLATMNPLDRGVDEVDAALDRRFAKIAMEPDDVLLANFLGDAGMDGALLQRILRFFREVNSMANSNPFASLGHTYFIGVKDEDGLRRVWEHQLRFHFDKAFRIDAEGRERVDRLWNEAVVGTPTKTADEGEEAVGSPEQDQE